jgi:hypothetical protein
VPDERTCSRARDIDRLDADQRDLRREVREEYLRKDVYVAERDGLRGNIKRLQDDDTSKASGNRTWLLGLLQMVLAVVLGSVAAYLTARGAH